MITTIKLRLRDRHSADLSRQSRTVNYVWNFVNETQRESVRRYRLGTSGKFLSKYDYAKLCYGTGKELSVASGTIEEITRQYETSRRTHKKPWLRWRGRKSLGWVPFRGRQIRFDGEQFIFARRKYRPMHLRDLLTPETKVLTGSFNSDARGRWYINVTVEIPDDTYPRAPDVPVGVDLGLKDLATLSTGSKVYNQKPYREREEGLARAQRARKRKRVRAIHAKIANSRKDALHKASTEIARNHSLIFVGDVSSKQLARTRMAKSVLDAGWYDFKSMLAYKAIRHGGRMVEVDERYTTQGCSHCGLVGGPRGAKDLGIREWTCSGCGVHHDRDVNAARNILRVGTDTLEGGASNQS